MTNILNARIILSVATILAAAALIAGATFAFFSDTETSEGNTFTAGSIDLLIDNTSYAIDCNIPGTQETPYNCTGAFVASAHTTWGPTNLTTQKFFDFIDLKPGDYGEDTISIRVEDNDAYVCAAARVDDENENYSEALASEINFIFWADDGDNVLEQGEETTIFLNGPISGIDAAGQIALVDTDTDVWGDDNAPLPVPGDTTKYIGKGWCFGDLTPSPAPQLGIDENGEAIGSPLDDAGTGFICDGSVVTSQLAQGGTVTGDIEFYAVQSRNNDTFTCGEGYTPTWENI